MRRALVLLSVIVAACSTSSAPTTVTEGATPDPTAAVTQETTTTTGAVTPDPTPTPGSAGDECFPVGVPFEQEGFMGRRDLPGDATSISDISWTDSGDCAVLTVAFRTAQGAPAVDPPAYRGELLRDLGVIRIAFGPQVDDAAISSLTIETPLMDAGHVVLDPESGALELDVVLADAALARIRTASAPARLVIEIIEGGPALSPRPENGRSTVLLGPSPETTAGPLVVEGYGSAGSSITIRVRSNGPVRERIVDLAPSPTAWTAFRWTVGQLPAGMVEVEAGDAPKVVLDLR